MKDLENHVEAGGQEQSAPRSSTSFTPGPWYWHKRFEDDGRNGSVFHFERPGHAYSVAMQPQFTGAAQWEADAHLISAAPDMYAALEECVGALSSDAMQSCWAFLYAHNYTWAGPVVDLDKARSALRKARGE